uniref:Uncharacterized protein n=1 Tax=Desulfacinum infernum TaxID=35837 RepID=A0A831ZJ54_9BACT
MPLVPRIVVDALVILKWVLGAGRELRHEAFQKMKLLRNLGMIHEPLNEEMIGLCFQVSDYGREG